VDILKGLEDARALLESPDGDGEYEVREILSGLYKVHDYESMGNRPVGTYDCGSVELADTPKALYRALFLFKPVGLSFKDMYKGTLLTLASPDYSLVATVEFFKYELAVYFSASKDHVSGTKGSAIIGGAPGSDNGIQFKGEVATAWFGFLVDLLNRQWMVYGGNDFEV
jgi:hypothetical protein